MRYTDDYVQLLGTGQPTMLEFACTHSRRCVDSGKNQTQLPIRVIVPDSGMEVLLLSR